jgi:hypothetical protein
MKFYHFWQQQSHPNGHPEGHQVWTLEEKQEGTLVLHSGSVIKHFVVICVPARNDSTRLIFNNLQRCIFLFFILKFN